MEMRIDKRGAKQQALRIDQLMRRRIQSGGHFDNLSRTHRNGHPGTAIGQAHVFKQQIEH